MEHLEKDQLFLYNVTVFMEVAETFQDILIIAHSLEDFSFGDIDGHWLGNSKGEGKIPFNIKVFKGNPKSLRIGLNR